MAITQNDNPSYLKVIVLDFDGTLVESNHIKDQAFETIFSEWPDHKDAMLAWHLPRNTVDRREKFRYFVEEILGQDGNQGLIDTLNDRFSELTRHTIAECPWVEGAQEFLEECQGKLPLYLVSATPQDELEGIVKERSLCETFERTYGAPLDKVEVLKEIMATEEASPQEMIYIGDSPEDQEAAVSLDIHFIGIESDRGLKGSTDSIFPNFEAISRLIGTTFDLHRPTVFTSR